MAKETALHKQNLKGAIVDVQPLRKEYEISELIEALEMSPNNGARNAFLFKLGISTGLRAGDLVKLRIEDVKGRTSFIIREGKTRKARTVYLDAIMPEVSEYVATLGRSDGWLFPSRKGDGHISVTQVYRILAKAGEMIGRNDIGTHTMRKTFGFHHYQRQRDVAQLMDIFNHSSQAITLRYIGIDEEEKRNSVRGMRLF